LAQGGEYWPQVPALVGEPVVVSRWVLAVGDLGEHPGLDEAGQALAEHVARDPESLLEVVEAGHAEEGVAEDQQRPPRADDLQALRD
jgi:hypothetical protein